MSSIPDTLIFLIVFPFTQSNVKEKSIFVPVAVFISWTIAVGWLNNIQPHSCVKHQYDISVSSTPPQISVLLFFFFQHISAWKDLLQLLSLNWLYWPTTKKLSPRTFPAHNVKPNTAELFIIPSKLSCFLLLSISARGHFLRVASTPDKYAFPTNTMFQRLPLSSVKNSFFDTQLRLLISMKFFILLNITVICSLYVIKLRPKERILFSSCKYITLKTINQILSLPFYIWCGNHSIAPLFSA